VVRSMGCSRGAAETRAEATAKRAKTLENIVVFGCGVCFAVKLCLCWFWLSLSKTLVGEIGT
jgi:hypothetical protein